METITDVLAAVAAGQITPEEASTLIDGMRSPAAPVGSSDGERVTEVFIKAGGARLIVIGDPAVAEAVADGIHRMERSNGTLLITTNQAQGDFSTTPPRSAFRGWLDSWMERAGQTLTVRVNPALPLRVLNVGGSLELTGVHGGASIGVEAGSAALEGGSGPLNLDVASGSAKVSWTFTGSSTIKADMGSASVRVVPGSDVVVTTEASLGQATVFAPEVFHKTSGDEPTPGVSVGRGAGRLHVVARMGSAKVTWEVNAPLYRAPAACPVCAQALMTTRLGCPQCGTEVSGAFQSCAYCRLGEEDLQTLEVFLRSRGNMRDLQAHLGVSYPTARQRFADLLARLGFAEPQAGPTQADILAEVAAGQLTVEQAAQLLG